MGDWTRVPVINIEGIEDGNKINQIAEEIHNACRDVGFFYISNHGVPIELQNQLEEFSKQFFSLPMEEKMKISMDKAGKAWRGFFPVGGELTSGRIDQKEGIYFGTESSPGLPMHGSNQWPSFPKEIESVVSEYILRVTKLGQLLMTAIAIGLGLPSDYFHKRFTDNPTVLFRIFNYPVHNFSDEDDEWGVREHTDMGFLTVLKQDNSGGLEVRNKIGQWISAPPIDNTFVVNIGDMLEYWTHGLYTATLHRVRNLANHDRLSFPLFFDPNWNASLTPIQEPISKPQNTINQESSKRWDNLDLHALENTTYGDFVWNKISKVFPDLASASSEAK